MFNILGLDEQPEGNEEGLPEGLKDFANDIMGGMKKAIDEEKKRRKTVREWLSEYEQARAELDKLQLPFLERIHEIEHDMLDANPELTRRVQALETQLMASAIEHGEQYKTPHNRFQFKLSEEAELVNLLMFKGLCAMHKELEQLLEEGERTCAVVATPADDWTE